MAQQNREAKRQFILLLNKLDSPKEADRLAAEQQLLDMGPEALEELLSYFERAERLRKNFPRILIWFVLGSFFLGMVNALLGSGVGAGLFGGVAAPIIVGMLLWLQHRNNAVRILAQFDDIRAVGPLAGALKFAEGKARPAVVASLIRLLPKLEFGDSSLLNPNQRQYLYKALAGTDTQLNLAILKALSQVGDSSAVPHVQQLLSSAHKDLQEAAGACLLAIEKRAEQENTRQTLLRASDAIETKPGILLRAAAETSTTDPQELLRPNVQQE